MRIFILSLILLAGCSFQKDKAQEHYSGTLELTEHVLGTKVPGRLATLKVKEGDTVKTGEVIATLDRYDQVLKDFERVQELHKTGGATAQSVEYAKLALEDQQIISPVEGVVLVKAADLGETLLAGAGVVVIGNPQEQWIKVFVPEGAVGRVKMGQKAAIEVDGLNKIYEGHVNFIATKGEFTPRNLQSKEDRTTQVFAVKVIVNNPDEYIHPGVSAEVTFKP